MDSVVYKGILVDNLNSSPEKLGLRADFVFQHDNDLYHSSKFVLSFLTEEAIEILKLLSQSPVINPIKHLWEELIDRSIN